MFSKAFIAAAAATLVAAQRPNGTSICDYYTGALLKDNNATNQYTLLTLLVNTAAIGNYTQPNHNAVPGILNPNATYMGRPVDLLPYFTGALYSTNQDGKAVSQNFLDGGGATPLMMNKPANDTTSAQYMLLTHLYQYFGALLGCSEYGNMGFPAYKGNPNLAEVHRFMDLNSDQTLYFIDQVGLAATSFGVSADDAAMVGKTLTDAFDYRCSPAVSLIPNTPKQPQAICQNPSCPLSPNANCSLYWTEMEPSSVMMAGAMSTMMSSSMMMNMTATSTMAMGAGATGASMTTEATAAASYTGSAAKTFGNVVAAVGAAAVAAVL